MLRRKNALKVWMVFLVFLDVKNLAAQNYLHEKFEINMAFVDDFMSVNGKVKSLKIKVINLDTEYDYFYDEINLKEKCIARKKEDHNYSEHYFFDTSGNLTEKNYFYNDTQQVDKIFFVYNKDGNVFCKGGSVCNHDLSSDFRGDFSRHLYLLYRYYYNSEKHIKKINLTQAKPVKNLFGKEKIKYITGNYSRFKYNRKNQLKREKIHQYIYNWYGYKNGELSREFSLRFYPGKRFYLNLLPQIIYKNKAQLQRDLQKDSIISDSAGRKVEALKFIGNNLKYKIKFYYNQEGQVEKREIYYFDNDDFSIKTYQYLYFKNGHLHKEIYTSGEEKFNSKTFTELDQNGNWIKMIEYDKGKQRAIKYREIEYY